MPAPADRLPPPPAPRVTWRRVLAGAGIAGALAAVFASYLRTDLVMTLATRVRACF